MVSPVPTMSTSSLGATPASAPGAHGSDTNLGELRAHVTGRDQHPVGLQQGAVFATHGTSPAVDLQCRRTLGEPMHARPGRPHRRLLEHRFEVVAVDPARHEVAGIDAGVDVLSGPAQEVLGVVRVGRHQPRHDVQPVPIVGRGVRDAATRGGCRVDQGDAHRAAAPAGLVEQPGRRESAGGAGADDHKTRPI
jgi:hypothetical protein